MAAALHINAHPCHCNASSGGLDNGTVSDAAFWLKLNQLQWQRLPFDPAPCISRHEVFTTEQLLGFRATALGASLLTAVESPRGTAQLCIANFNETLAALAKAATALGGGTAEGSHGRTAPQPSPLKLPLLRPRSAALPTTAWNAVATPMAQSLAAAMMNASFFLRLPGTALAITHFPGKATPFTQPLRASSPV